MMRAASATLLCRNLFIARLNILTVPHFLTAHLRIEQAVNNIGDDVEDDDEYGYYYRAGQYDAVVTAVNGLDHVVADAGNGIEPLGNER